MTSPETNDNTHNVNFDADALAPRELRVVLVCDVVESVRWMEQDEDYAVTRWQAFAHHVRSTIVPAHGGSVVKSTGDGMMVEFTNARSAVQAANALHAKAAQGNTNPNPQRHLQLRTGIHETHARRDAHDLYGHGVNLAARITTLAGPGEIIVSAPVRGHLTDSLDGDIEDMGECYLKHIAEPQRVYRVGAASVEPILVPQKEYAPTLKTTIAVVPFTSRAKNDELFAVGDMIADSVIGVLGRSSELSVISKSSSTSLKNKEQLIELANKHLNTNYLITGSYLIVSDQLLIWAELVDCSNSTIAWCDSIKVDKKDLFELHSEVSMWIASNVHNKMLSNEAEKSTNQPMPTLQSYSLLLGAIAMVQRQTRAEFNRGKEFLDHLVNRHPHAASPRGWIANWHILSVVQGWTLDAIDEGKRARIQLEKCLEKNPDDSFALALSGLVSAYLFHDLDKASGLYDSAISINNSEPLAWLCRSTLHSYQGEGSKASAAAKKALALTPLDPMRYFYNSLAATAVLANGDYQEAINLAQKSLKANRNHTSTYRTLAIAQSLKGQADNAKKTVSQLMLLEPDLTIEKYIKRYPGRDAPHAVVYAQALKDAGVPS